MRSGLPSPSYATVQAGLGDGEGLAHALIGTPKRVSKDSEGARPSQPRSLRDSSPDGASLRSDAGQGAPRDAANPTGERAAEDAHLYKVATRP